MYCTRCNKVFVFVFDQDVGDVTKDRSDGRPVWLEMPRQQRHRHISITPRKNTELLLILLVVTRHNYWIATLFSMHFVKSVWLLSGQDGRPWFMYCTRCNSHLAGSWNQGIIAHQTPHFRRPPKHVNNKGPSVFAQTSSKCTFLSGQDGRP